MLPMLCDSIMMIAPHLQVLTSRFPLFLMQPHRNRCALPVPRNLNLNPNPVPMIQGITITHQAHAPVPTLILLQWHPLLGQKKKA